MTINVKQWKLRLRGVVLHHFDCLSNPQPVLELLDAVTIAFPRLSFDGEITANRVDDQFRQRRLKPMAKNWAKVRSEIQAGAISTLVFGSMHTNTYDWHAGVAFQMFHERSRRRNPNTPGHYDEVAFWVDHHLFQDDIVSVANCIDLLQQAWEKLNGLYAFADLFISNQRGDVSQKLGQEASALFRAKVSTHEVSSPRADLTKHVPDAYWLNFLNANHVKALGDVEQICSKLPKAQIESIAHEGMSIQISPSPAYESFEEWQTDHVALEHILTPILTKYQWKMPVIKGGNTPTFNPSF